jgi:hypothetical protein
LKPGEHAHGKRGLVARRYKPPAIKARQTTAPPKHADNSADSKLLLISSNPCTSKIKVSARKKNRGLVFLRRSSGRQESSLQTQLEWAIREAEKLGVRLDACLADLELMQARGLHSYKDIRLDDSITGADLQRPGFLALKANALSDKSVSHIFLVRRDRLARPDEATTMVAIEKEMRYDGITFVMLDKVGRPLDRGLHDPGEELSMWFDYVESGEFLRKHAERIISSKISLGKGGYWAGGRAPYGFARVLVDAAGTVLEELADGRRVRQSGCHVRVMPKDLNKIAIWCHILDLKHQGWGATRIGNHLNEMGIPSPDAGRTRTDHGQKHFVSGRWSTRTVLELCRNKAILGIAELGRRSDGAHRRIGKDGPRLLNDGDRDPANKGKPKRIQNAQEDVISSPTGFDSHYDPSKWAEIAEQLEERGRSQKGVPRAKDPARYPLATRVVDLTLGCGALMYGQTSGNRKLYTCGRYMRTCSAECENNSVDAEALLRFTVHTLQQYVVLAGGREGLRHRLEDRPCGQDAVPVVDAIEANLVNLEAIRTRLAEDVAFATRRVLIERDEARSQLLSGELDRLVGELKQAEATLEAARQRVQPVRTIEQDVEEAVELFSSIEKLSGDESSRLKMAELVKNMGLYIGLNFVAGVKGTKRQVRVLQGGLITFGVQGLPVPLFGDRRVGDPVKPIALEGGTPEGSTTDTMDCVIAQQGVVSADGHDAPPAAPSGLIVSREGGISYTKLSRGDRRWTFPNDMTGSGLLWRAIAQTRQFSADEFYAFGTTA